MYDCMLVHPFRTRTLMTLQVHGMYQCMTYSNIRTVCRHSYVSQISALNRYAKKQKKTVLFFSKLVLDIFLEII